MVVVSEGLVDSRVVVVNSCVDVIRAWIIRDDVTVDVSMACGGVNGVDRSAIDNHVVNSDVNSNVACGEISSTGNVNVDVVAGNVVVGFVAYVVATTGVKFTKKTIYFQA